MEGNPLSRIDPTGELFFIPVLVGGLGGAITTTGGLTLGQIIIGGAITGIVLSIPGDSAKNCKTCDDEPFSRYVKCSIAEANGFIYKIQNHALGLAARTVRKRNTKPMDSRGGPCYVGSGYKIGKYISYTDVRTGNQAWPSLGFCECCQDTAGGPQMQERWKRYIQDY